VREWGTIMKIPLQEVDYIAKLARLTLTKNELLVFTKQLNEIIKYMEKLNDVDTTGVSPTSRALHSTNALREDTLEPSLEKREALGNAPETDGDFFVVPKVI
jgi:aspartyl-tRNA(Asn)/glutamyl-tRNA(Gln) amidotransferase subunit C